MAPEPDHLLQKVKFSVNDKLEVKGTLEEETNQEQVITNPTDKVIAFKLKGTSPDIIRQKPGYGYIEPKGKVKIVVTIASMRNRAKLPRTQRITTMLAVAPASKPADAMDLWKDAAVVAGARRHALKVTFKRKKGPAKKAGKKADKTEASLGDENEEESSEGEGDDSDESSE